MLQQCTHLDQIKLTKPKTHICEECVQSQHMLYSLSRHILYSFW